MTNGNSNISEITNQMLLLMNGDNEKSPHILNASANLLGICFIVLTSLKLLKQSQKTIIDDMTLIAIILFMGSCLFSFLSLGKKGGAGLRLERIADFIFIAGLGFLFVTTLLFSFNFIR